MPRRKQRPPPDLADYSAACPDDLAAGRAAKYAYATDEDPVGFVFYLPGSGEYMIVTAKGRAYVHKDTLTFKKRG